MVSLASAERTNGVIAPGVGGSLKRKHSDFDANDLTSSQLKRRRVTFDPDVDIRILPDVNEKSLELVGEEVRRALEKHTTGDNVSYEQIKGLITMSPIASDAPSTALLEKYVIALTNHVPLLDHNSAGMVHAVIDNSWIARNEHYVSSYMTLLRSIVSVHPGYTSDVLRMVIDMFLELPSPTIRQHDDPAIQRSRLQHRVHNCLKHLLRSSPMISSFLAPVITSTFPFPTDTIKAHTQYIKNILKVSGYCPELKGQILSLVTDKLVKIDVQIQVDMEELEDDIEERLVEATDEDNEYDDGDSDSESVSSEQSENQEARRMKTLKDSVTKLDSIMEILFSHYASVFASGNLAEIDDIFESLLSQFSNIILPTYRSRHTQFLLFHFSQTSPELMERFAGCCSHLAFDQRLPQILRIAAAAYLASFIARGANVSPTLVRDVFDLLCQHLENLRISQEPSCKGPNLQRYGTYYAITQALLYTFCFRWRDLLVTEDGTSLTDEEVQYHETDFIWHNGIQDILRRNIFSKLNPLKICAPTIVNQFARMAHHLRFLYVFPLLETNKRIRLARHIGTGYMEGMAVRETALTSKKGEESFLLDAYFPFDPYVLPRSKRWIEQDYVQWKPVPGMKSTNEDEEDFDEEEGEEEEGEDDDESESDAEGTELHDDEVDDDTGTEASA